MRRAEAENFAAQCPEFGGAHFEANEKKKHDDAEFGEVEDVFRIADQAQPVRADQHAGGEIAKYRAQPQTPEERRGHDGCRQQRHGVLKP